MMCKAAQGSPIFLGTQSFQKIRRCGGFYADKTAFVADWWRQGAAVTLLTRPRRFGKTLLLDTVRCFFSDEVTDQAALFSGLAVWQAEDLRPLAGSRPVISLTWSGCGGLCFETIRDSLWVVTDHLYDEFHKRLRSPKLAQEDRRWFEDIAGGDRTEALLVNSIRCLCRAVWHATGVKPLLLMDEVDTPLLQAAEGACREEAKRLLTRLLTATLAENPWLHRGLLAGIASHAAAPLLSGIPRLAVDSVMTPVQTTCCGFTAEEVRAALEERGRAEQADSVRAAYEGWRLGSDVLYSPWEVTNFLWLGELRPWWVNSGGRTQVDELLLSGGAGGMKSLTELLQGCSVAVAEGEAPWTMLWESGYLTAAVSREGRFELVVSSAEVRQFLEECVSRWFLTSCGSWRVFLEALIEGDEGCLEWAVNRLWQATEDRFAGDAECFLRALALAVMLKLREQYAVTMPDQKTAPLVVRLRCLGPSKKEAFGLAVAVRPLGAAGELEAAADALLKRAVRVNADAEEGRGRAAAMVFQGGAFFVRMSG